MIEKLKTLREWSEKMIESGELFGIPISRFKELFDLFMEEGYNLRNEKEWKSIKRDFFNIVNNEGGKKEMKKRKCTCNCPVIDRCACALFDNGYCNYEEESKEEDKN